MSIGVARASSASSETAARRLRRKGHPFSATPFCFLSAGSSSVPFASFASFAFFRPLAFLPSSASSRHRSLSRDADAPAALADELQSRVAARVGGLAEHKHPRRVVVHPAPLPRTPTGKVRRHLVAAWVRSQESEA